MDSQRAPQRDGEPARHVIPIQPQPIQTSVNRFRSGFEVVTSIVRIWPPGTVGPDGYCKRCPRCFADGNLCHLQVNLEIEDGEDFSLSGRGFKLKP